MRTWLGRGFLSLTAWLVLVSGYIQADEPAAEPPPRNRIDFTSVFFDSIDTDSFTGTLEYSRNVSESLNLAAEISYLDSRFGAVSGSGFGDSVLTLSWLPSADLAFGPWLQRIVGTGFSVTLPIGDETEGRGLGSTVVTPFLGTVFAVSDTVAIAPTLIYSHSLDTITTGADIRIGVADLAVTWIGRSGWWASAAVNYSKDLKADDTAYGGRLAAGKVFRSRWGLAASFTDQDSVFPGVVPTQPPTFDQIYELSVNKSF